jgi:hypothetical protein
VESYYPQGRIAFNHSEPDGTSLPAVAKMYVVKVTPEGITLQGKSDIGSSKGFFDRRTGHGIITEFKKYGKGDLALGGRLALEYPLLMNCFARFSGSRQILSGPD